MTTAKVISTETQFEPVVLEIVITSQEDLEILFEIGNLSTNSWISTFNHKKLHSAKVRSLAEKLFYHPLKQFRTGE
jgi:hypothetical protein